MSVVTEDEEDAGIRIKVNKSSTQGFIWVVLLSFEDYFKINLSLVVVFKD